MNIESFILAWSSLLSWLSELSHDKDRFAPIVTLIIGVISSATVLAIGLMQSKNTHEAAVAATKSAEASMLNTQLAGFREIAKLRIGWMDTLRNTLAEYHASLMNLEDDDGTSDENLRERRRTTNEKLALLGTQLDLLLNQSDKAQKALWDITDKIYHLEKSEDRQREDRALIEAARIVFKEEWEKIKREMQDGDAQR